MDNSITEEPVVSPQPSGPVWLHPIPDERRCQARSKRTGQRCGAWAVPGRRTCRHHGGLSRGPKNPAFLHGYACLDAMKFRMAQRVMAAAIKERKEYALGFIIPWIGERIEAMTYAEYRRIRNVLSDFAAGNVSIKKLIFTIDCDRKTGKLKNV